MTQGPRETAPMARAIEENGAEFLMEIGRAAGSEVRDDGRVRWAIGNSPIDYFNCVAYADLTGEEANREITASIERLRAQGVPGSWHVGPSMRPPDLGARLLAHGFEYGGDDIGMAVDLQALPEAVAVPEGFVVERVRDEAGLAEWTTTFGMGFGVGPAEAGWIGEMFRRLGLATKGRGVTTSGGWPASRWPRPRCSSRPGSRGSTASPPSSTQEGGAWQRP